MAPRLVAVRPGSGLAQRSPSGDNAGLNHPQPDGHGYAVFGKVVKGMDVVDAIRGVPTTTKGPFRDVPAEPVTIESVSVVAGR